MKKYNQTTIKNYINGEEVENIDKLESDQDFMLEVMRKTRDKQIYNLCSDNLKKDSYFVQEVVELFQDDKEFIIKVANYCLEHLDKHSSEYWILNIVMRNILKQVTNDEDNQMLLSAKYQYNFHAIALLIEEKGVIECKLMQEERENGNSDYGLGFILCQYYEGYNNTIILDYMAENYINDIFFKTGNLKKLEKYLHDFYKKPQSLIKGGITNFIVRYIERKDQSLAQYTAVHNYLLTDVLKEVERIIRNWDNYERVTEEDKYLEFQEKVDELIEKYDSNYYLAEYLAYLDTLNLNLNQKLDKYNLDEYNLDIDYLDFSTNINDYKCLKEIITLAKKYFSNNKVILEKKEKISIPETKRKAKILFYDDKKNTKKGDNNE